MFWNIKHVKIFRLESFNLLTPINHPTQENNINTGTYEFFQNEEKHQINHTKKSVGNIQEEEKVGCNVSRKAGEQQIFKVGLKLGC